MTWETTGQDLHPDRYPIYSDVLRAPPLTSGPIAPIVGSAESKVDLT